MADAAELFGALRKRPGTRYTALWLNAAGFERARAVPQVDLDGTLYFYASDAFSRQNNGRVRPSLPRASGSGSSATAKPGCRSRRPT